MILRLTNAIILYTTLNSVVLYLCINGRHNLNLFILQILTKLISDPKTDDGNQAEIYTTIEVVKYYWQI
jgi:hypothetical protein